MTSPEVEASSNERSTHQQLMLPRLSARTGSQVSRARSNSRMVVSLMKSSSSDSIISRLSSRSRSSSLNRLSSGSLTESIHSKTIHDTQVKKDLKLYKRNLEMAMIEKDRERNGWVVHFNRQTKDSGRRVNRTMYSYGTKEEAHQSVYANSPPKMVPTKDCSHCFLCESDFHQVFNRPLNCRNCGVCICNKCSIGWKKEMVPDTYNVRNSNIIQVCKTCDYLATKFRCALLDGQFKRAMKVYRTGNINVRCPFVNVHPSLEVMYPIHCAIMSGNLELIQWLIESLKCPYESYDKFIPTSHGRTIIDIAMEKNHLDVLRYLVQEQNLILPDNNAKQQLMKLSALQDENMNAQQPQGKSMMDPLKGCRGHLGKLTNRNGTILQSICSMSNNNYENIFCKSYSDKDFCEIDNNSIIDN